MAAYYSGGMTEHTRFFVSSGGSSILRSTATKDGPDDTGQRPVLPCFYLVLPVDSGRPGWRGQRDVSASRVRGGGRGGNGGRGWDGSSGRRLSFGQFH